MQTIFHWLTLELPLELVLDSHWGSRCGSRWGWVGHYKLMLGIIGLCCASFARVRGNVGSASIFRYQHVGIINAKSSRWGSKPIQGERDRVLVEYRLKTP